jgi:hypothetical protein
MVTVSTLIDISVFFHVTGLLGAYSKPTAGL